MELIYFDHDEIAARGGNLCGEDAFAIGVCGKCSSQYLYNQVLHDVYFDPTDLQRRFFKIEGMALPPCRGCGQLGWELLTDTLEPVEQLTGPWAWALYKV